MTTLPPRGGERQHRRGVTVFDGSGTPPDDDHPVEGEHHDQFAAADIDEPAGDDRRGDNDHQRRTGEHHRADVGGAGARRVRSGVRRQVQPGDSLQTIVDRFDDETVDGADRSRPRTVSSPTTSIPATNCSTSASTTA